MYDGRTGIPEGVVFGHEIMGVVDDVGEAVTQIKTGDRVVLPFNVSCGTCFNCVRGLTHSCLVMNPEKPGAAYGYAGMGPYDGGQAEFVRVPFADFNCLKLPGKPGDKFEDHFLMLADIFPTGYHAAELAGVKPGTSVAIYGAGPVGLLAAHSALLKGASEVFVVDRSEERLKVAKQFGAIAVNFEEGSPAEQIKDIRKNNPLLMESLRPGEEKLMGVDCGIDAVGYQALSIEHPDQEDPTAVINELAEVVNAGGGIGIIGVFADADVEGVDEDAKKGVFKIPLGKIWDKALSIGTGQCPVKKYNEYLRNLIIAGKAAPGQIVSHHLPLEEAPQAYKLFDYRGVGEGKKYTKVVLKP
jgi:glutathione-independent formaldehyde dehydrogenase